MFDRLSQAMVATRNDAVDAALLEAIRLGNPQEQSEALGILIQRQSTDGLGAVVEQFDDASPAVKLHVMKELSWFHHALREAARSERSERRLAAIRLIGEGRQGKLAYVLAENLGSENPDVARAAGDALVNLAGWVAEQTRLLQRGDFEGGVLNDHADRIAVSAAAQLAAAGDAGDDLVARKKADDDGNNAADTNTAESTETAPDRPLTRPTAALLDDGKPWDGYVAYHQLIGNRSEIEDVLARAISWHRPGAGQAQDLVSAVLLLCDWPGSKTLSILQTAKHTGQSMLVRRLQQPPAPEHVPAFMLAASHGQLRSHFGSVFAHITDPGVLGAILDKTHWLKDLQLQLCMHQVSRGIWWSEADLAIDLQTRTPVEAARIGQWLAVSGMHDLVQDERLERLAKHCADDVAARVQLLRVAASRKKGTSTGLLKSLLADADERIVRMAARELIRRQPTDYENTLLQLMTGTGETVRRVVGRAIGQAGFDHFWNRFDRMDKPTRRQAGKAMLKLLPDATARLSRRLTGGTIEQRLKAMQLAQELGLADALREPLLTLVGHSNPKVRSKAVVLVGGLPSVKPEVLLERALEDVDGRVRSNAIEVLEAQKSTQFLPTLLQRARSAHNRERANAIKALHRMKLGTVGPELLAMLRDARPEHRVSAMWLLNEIGWWKLIGEVGRLARTDTNLRVRRYALGVLKDLATTMKASPPPPAATA
jgi:HEAT repeat protein